MRYKRTVAPDKRSSRFFPTTLRVKRNSMTLEEADQKGAAKRHRHADVHFSGISPYRALAVFRFGGIARSGVYPIVGVGLVVVIILFDQFSVRRCDEAVANDVDFIRLQDAV
jgi:hypothetical protein